MFTSRKKKDILEETQREKAVLESDILFRIIKENLGIIDDYLLSSFNNAVDKCYFPTALKQANIIPLFKTGERY